MADDALLQRFHVDDDVWKFGQVLSNYVASLQTAYKYWKWLVLSALLRRAWRASRPRPQIRPIRFRPQLLLRQLQFNLLACGIKLADAEAANLARGRCVRFG